MEKVVVSKKQQKRVHSVKYIFTCGSWRTASYAWTGNNSTEARRSRAHLTRLRRKAHTTVPLNDLPSSWRFATKSPVPSPRASLRRRQQGRRQLCRRPFFKRCTVQFGRSTQLRLRQRINKFRNRRARVETSAGAGAPAVGEFDRRARRSRREPSGRLSPRGRDSRARDSQA